jgi:hypothetical protein
MRENIRFLVFWARLTSLRMIELFFIFLFRFVYFLWWSVTLYILLIFSLLSYNIFIYSWQKFLSFICFASIFSLSVACLFIPLCFNLHKIEYTVYNWRISWIVPIVYTHVTPTPVKIRTYGLLRKFPCTPF